MKKNSIRQNTVNKNDKNNLSPVLARLEEMRKVRDKYDEKWDTELNDYQNNESTLTEDGPDDYRSSLKIPTLTGLVDTKVADELKLPFIPTFIPDNEEAIPYTEVNTKIFDSVWRNIKGKLHRQIAVHQKNVFGDSFIMGLWRFETREVKQITDIVDGKPVYESKTIVPYDDIKLYNVEPRYLLFDYSAEFLEDCNDAAYDRPISKDTFIAYYGGNSMFNGEEVKKAMSAACTQRTFKTNYEDNTQEDDKLVNVVDYFNILTDTYQVIANGFVIYEGPMPIKMLPIVHYRNRYKTGSFYSASERDLTKDLIEEKDVHRNMIIDFNKFNIHSPILVQQSVEFDEENYEFGPGIIWRVGDTSQVRRLPLPNIVSAPFETESMFDADITKIAGVDINSLVAGSNESATKTISKKRNQLSRLEPMMSYNSMTADERLIMVIMEYVNTYYSIPRTQKYLNEEELASYKEYREARIENFDVDIDSDGMVSFTENKGNISFLDIKPEYLGKKFLVDVSTQEEIPVSKELKEQKALELLQVFNAIPLDENGKLPAHIQPVAKMLLESGDFNKEDFKALFEEAKAEVDPVASQLQGMGIIAPGNQQVGRAPTPQETQQSFGQQSMTDITNPAAMGQLTAQDVGV